MILAERAARREAEAVAARAQAVNSHLDPLRRGKADRPCVRRPGEGSALVCNSTATRMSSSRSGAACSSSLTSQVRDR